MRILKCGYASQQYNFILTQYTNALYVKHFFNFFFVVLWVINFALEEGIRAIFLRST